MAEWLYNLSKVDIHINGEEFFINACENGRRDMAEWLYNLSIKNNNNNNMDNITTKIDINIYNDEAFCLACEKGHRDVAEWLYNLSKEAGNTKINIHTSNEILEFAFHNFDEILQDDYAFVISCRNGHKDIAEWLYNLSKIDDNGKININQRDNIAFRWTYKEGHQNIAIWLYNLSKIDNNIEIDTDQLYNHYAFRWA